MLKDKILFEKLQREARSNGILDRFEKENGPVRGRMLITVIDIPEELCVEPDPDRTCVAFEASFDFYDVAMGIAVYLDPVEPASGVWFTPQVEGAEQPTQDWVMFFVDKLFGSFKEDGSFGYPICSFMSDTSDVTIVPVKDE